MKDFLLIGLVLFVIVSLFADGGLDVSPELSPALDAALTVNYAPDRRVETTHIEQQTNIDTNIEQQTVIVSAQPAAAPSSGGSSVVDGRPGGACFTVPGDVIVDQGSNGECHVVNNGQRYFIGSGGTRNWLRAQDDPTAHPTPLAAVPVTTIDGRWLAIVPLDEMSTDQLKANFVRNGGHLPLGFRFWTDKEQRIWLTARPEAWR